MKFRTGSFFRWSLALSAAQCMLIAAPSALLADEPAGKATDAASTGAAPAGTSSTGTSTSGAATDATSAGGTTAAPATAAPATAAPATAAPASTKPKASGPYALQCAASAGGFKMASVAKVQAPTAAQLRALQILQTEADSYTEGARDFKGTLTTIVRGHYEERRRRVLSTLDKEIDLERKGLHDARNEAIRRLEEFVARYSGPNADPLGTPDAMFRLAALYEERAREDFDADLNQGLRPAVDLYRRIVAEYPSYEEIAAVHYYLGHALTDAARMEEAQHAWRALVCSNRYQVRTDPKNAEAIEVQKLLQDHDDAFWTEWYNKNPIPLDQMGGKRGKLSEAGVKQEELTFIDPYANCEPLAQKTPIGDEPRYLAEVWWQLGNFHFDQLDVAGGPYGLNRAVSAYARALAFKKPPLYGVSLYKQAWAYFKQQRYRTAVQSFVNLLHYADEQQAKTGDPGADFRSEAFTYIAGSLTYVDFDGPPENDPNIPRNDVLDVESDPLVAEQKMAVAIDRVQDTSLIPQDKKWTVEIYKALAQEFTEITQNRNAIRTLEITVNRFPLDRDAPVMVNKVAELYDQLSRLAPEGSPVRTEYAARALEARTKLSGYVGATPWTNANRDDAEALSTAEELVRVGLRRAAADHTNYGRAYKDRALQLSDPGEQIRLLDKAIEEYRLGAQGWSAVLDQDPSAQDAYDSRFWLADSRFWAAVLQVPLGRSPTNEEVVAAREAASSVRDSNENDKYKQPAAYYVVTLAEKVLEDEYRKNEQSAGAQGVAHKTAVTFEGTDDKRTVVREEIPGPVQQAICARDEYNARIPVAEDPEKNGTLYAYQSGDYFFVYGQFAEARTRFKPLYDAYCGKNEWGYKAWEKLISMSNFEGNAEESRRLAEGKSCAFDEETRVAEEAIRKPVKQGVAYLDARKLYEEAEKMAPGPARDKKWRAAAAAYKVALDAAPDRDEAPEAAMNGAFAYKQVGEYDKAISMYELFIARYGNEGTLQKLKNGDPKATPPTAAQPEKYEARVGFLSSAYQALAGAYVLFFDYPKAAATFDTIGKIEHFSTADRKEATKQALSLYSSLDDSTGMTRSRERYQKLGASDQELAEAEFVIASAPLAKWDEKSPNEGANQRARLDAQAAMETYYGRNKNRDAAAKFVVQAAYNMARFKKAVGSGDENKWWQNTISSFDRYQRLAPRKDNKSSALGSREASMAAEGEYTMLDAELRRNFDYEAGHHRYRGTVDEVIKKYVTVDSVEAKKWYAKLQHVIDAYVSPEWTTVALARQGSVWDSLRTGLYNTRPPELKMFDAKTERLLKMADETGDEDMMARADEARIKVQTAWRTRRDQELDGADTIVVDRYAKAVVLARRYNQSNAAVTRAIRRLAFLTDVVGEAKMAQFTAGEPDLKYTPGMFQRMRPGVIATPETNGLPEPLPAAVQ